MKRLPKIPATAGKVLRFRIPPETFSDVLDGNADQLELKLLPPVDSSGRTIRDFVWIGFNSLNNVIYFSRDSLLNLYLKNNKKKL